MFAAPYLQTETDAPVWVWYVMLGLLLLLVILWWLVNRRGGEPAIRPVSEAVSTTTEPDDLQRIEGIGPKVARVLQEAGITTFVALSRAEPADIQSTLKAAGLQMMNPEGWIEQAGLAAKGDWDGLERLQAELKGGRRQ